MSPHSARRIRDDQLYEAVSEGRRHPGMEHWLPLFQERMDTLFDYLDGTPIAIEPQSEDAARERFKQIADYYDARREAMDHPGSGAIYKPLPPDQLYLTEHEWDKRLEGGALARLTPFAVPDEASGAVIDVGARAGRNFAPERADTTSTCSRRWSRTSRRCRRCARRWWSRCGAKARATAWRAC